MKRCGRWFERFRRCGPDAVPAAVDRRSCTPTRHMTTSNCIGGCATVASRRRRAAAWRVRRSNRRTSCPPWGRRGSAGIPVTDPHRKCHRRSDIRIFGRFRRLRSGGGDRCGRRLRLPLVQQPGDQVAGRDDRHARRTHRPVVNGGGGCGRVLAVTVFHVLHLCLPVGASSTPNKSATNESKADASSVSTQGSSWAHDSRWSARVGRATPLECPNARTVSVNKPVGPGVSLVAITDFRHGR